MPKVSIIIPVFNAMKYLPTCLNSVVNQTLTNIEIIIVNDHSTDNSLDIIREYEKMYPKKIKVIDMVENYGVSWARNIGLDIAQGKYIGFVDADDVVSLNMYEDYVYLANRYNSDIVKGDFERITDRFMIKNDVFTTPNINHHSYRLIDYQQNPYSYIIEHPGIWNKIYNHDFLENTRFLENHLYEDIAFTYPILLKTNNNVIHVYRSDYKYRITPKGIMDTSKEEYNYQLMDIFDVSLYAKELGIKFNLSEYKQKLLEKQLTSELLRKIKKMSNWPLEDNERLLLINSLISLYDWYFNDMLKSYSAKFVYNSLKKQITCPSLVNSEEQALKTKQEILSLIRKRKLD